MASLCEDREVLNQNCGIQHGFFTPAVCIEGSIDKPNVQTPPTLEQSTLVSQKVFEMSVFVYECLGPSLFGYDPYEKTVRIQGTGDRLERRPVRCRVFANVLKRKVVTYDVKRTGKSRLNNASSSKEPHAKLHIVRSLLCLAQGLFVWVYGEHVDTGRLPLVPITASTTPAIKNFRPWRDPSLNQLTLCIIVYLSHVFT
jgi:hypothetical protein